MLQVIDSGTKSAFEHMQLDEWLLQEGVDEPQLRFYDWSSNAVTYGYFINPAEWLKIIPTNSARRPTGGGLIFHEGDFSFTIALPLLHPLVQKPVLERYQIINSLVLVAVKSLTPDWSLCLQGHKMEGTIDQLCMANPTEYDLLLGSKKVGGSAQRKNKRAFIHQCSLFLAMPDWNQICVNLIEPQYVLPKLKAFTGSLFSNKSTIPTNFRADLRAALHVALNGICTLL